MGHIMSLMPNKLAQFMAPTMTAAGEGMLQDVRRIDAKKAGDEFNEQPVEIGWRQLVEGTANVVGSKAGQWSGQLTAKILPRGSKIIETAVGIETSTVMVKGYDAYTGKIPWSQVFNPDLSASPPQ
jgi:hypothetical protein